MREKPYCQTGPKWIRDRVLRETGEKYALAPLTGQDARALSAFFHLVALYGNADEDGRDHALHAMAHAVEAMQPSTRHLAKVGIPHVLDWGDEDRIWTKVRLLPAKTSAWLDLAYDDRCRELASQREHAATVLEEAHRIRDERDALLAAARAASHLCQSLLAVREGATDELIREVSDALAAAIAGVSDGAGRDGSAAGRGSPASMAASTSNEGESRV